MRRQYKNSMPTTNRNVVQKKPTGKVNLSNAGDFQTHSIEMNRKATLFG